jgi:hypothetical protein
MTCKQNKYKKYMLLRVANKKNKYSPLHLAGSKTKLYAA